MSDAARVRQEGARRRLDAILGSLAEAVTVHDAEGRTVYANLPAAQANFTGADTRPRWVGTACGTGTVGPCVNRVNNAAGNQVTSAIVMKNQDIGRNWNLAFSASKPMYHGLTVRTAYSYGEAKNTIDPGSTAFASWSSNATPGDPNNPGLGFSSASPGHRFFLSRDEMIVGRDPAADIYLADDGISRRHAKITRRDGTVLLTDLGSANGTYLNDQRVASNGMPLAKEDMLRIGTSILKFLPAGELEIIFYGNLGAAAHTDPLTRIYNKGYLLEALGAEWKRARALHAELSLVFFDLDHFKKINDTFGHEAGDYVLQEMTRFIRGELLAPRDIFARYGGKEFAILLANTGGSRALELAERIRAAVEAHAFFYEGNRLPVTCSMGVATLQLGIDSAAALLKAADMAGYASKRTGRNRVTMADPLLGASPT